MRAPNGLVLGFRGLGFRASFGFLGFQGIGMVSGSFRRRVHSNSILNPRRTGVAFLGGLAAHVRSRSKASAMTLNPNRSHVRDPLLFVALATTTNPVFFLRVLYSGQFELLRRVA